MGALQDAIVTAAKRERRKYMILGWATVILLVITITGWIMNIYKLSECDFEKPYKAEVIHIVGLIPPIGAITGWLNVGK